MHTNRTGKYEGAILEFEQKGEVRGGGEGWEVEDGKY